MKQALDKMSFISDSCVKEFITWMLKKLDSDFEHRYKNLKTKEYWECSSIYNAYERYA